MTASIKFPTVVPLGTEVPVRSISLQALLSEVIPCYNEEEVLPQLYKRPAAATAKKVELQRLYPAFDESTVRQVSVQGRAGHSVIRPRGSFANAAVRGLAEGHQIAGNARVYPIDRNMSHCMEVTMQADLHQLPA